MLRSPHRISRHRTLLAGSAAATTVTIAFVWMLRPATGVPRADFVTVHSSDVRVTTNTPDAVESSFNGSSHPQQSQSAIPPRPLLSSVVLGADIFSPSFAPQGELLFHSGRNHSALMRATFDQAGTPTVATLLQDGATNYHATLSPDGVWLSYDSDRDGTRGVYVARADASESRKISGDGYAAVPRWSPDGRRLAFLKAEDQRPRVWNLWLADLATGFTCRVSAHDVGQTWGASWFPDGQRLAYSVEDKLVLAYVNNPNFRVIPSPRRGHLIRTPAVSPDGNYVVFQVHRDGGWLLDVARGTMRRVLADVAAEEFAWSPDSERVVFHTRRNGAWSVWQLELKPTVVAGAL